MEYKPLNRDNEYYHKVVSLKGINSMKLNHQELQKVSKRPLLPTMVVVGLGVLIWAVVKRNDE